MGLFKWILMGLGLLVLLTAGTGTYLYATDYAVEASVTEKGSDDAGRYIIVTPDLANYQVKRYLSQEQWSAVCVGNFVLYNVQSERVRLFTEKEGDLVYDSLTGEINAAAAARCAIAS